MKRNDIILIGVILLVGIGGFISLLFMQQTSGNIAIVSFEDYEVLHISLSDGSYEIINEAYIYVAGNDAYETDSAYKDACFVEDYIYCIKGALGLVVIKYMDGYIQVIDETSPQNICQLQGITNSPIKPLTCLPNHVIITIKDANESDYDVIT